MRYESRGYLGPVYGQPGIFGLPWLRLCPLRHHEVERSGHFASRDSLTREESTRYPLSILQIVQGLSARLLFSFNCHIFTKTDHSTIGGETRSCPPPELSWIFFVFDPSFYHTIFLPRRSLRIQRIYAQHTCTHMMGGLAPLDEVNVGGERGEKS